MDLSKYIASIEDFPEPGVTYRDITPLMSDGEAFRYAIQEIADYARKKDVDMIVGPEARGFIIGCPVAYELGIGFAPARKSDKLPRETLSVDYGLEYGDDTLEIHTDAIQEGQNILVVDDLLATGGTLSATIELVEELGGNVVGSAFLIELVDLKGREKIPGYDIFALLEY